MPKKSLRLDISMDELEGLALETKVDIAITGVVKSLEAERRFEPVEGDEDVFPPSIEVEVSKSTVKPAQNVFAEMAVDEVDA